MKKRIILLILLAFACLRASTQDPALHITFDAPFPPSPYKGVLAACMRVRSAVEALYAQRNQDDIEIMCDVIAGRLAQLSVTVEQLIPDIPAMHVEDREYMHTLLACMACEVAQLSGLANMGKSADLLVGMAEQIKNKVVQCNV